MLGRASIAALIALSTAALTTPAAGEIIITHAKALAGNITPGDTPGYPVTISLPGSYKFESTLVVPPGSHGIVVNNDDVTIDFAGFRLWSGGGAINGIVGFFNSLTIKNGTIANFAGRGIHGTGHFWSIDNMRIAEVGREGIFATGDSWTIANSQIVGCGGGIYVQGTNFLVRNNLINGNGQRGISLEQTGHVEGNIVAQNGGNAYIGVYIGDSGMVLGNTIVNNGHTGLYAGSSFVGYGNNTLSGNAGANPEVSGGFQLHPNTCNGAAC